ITPLNPGDCFAVTTRERKEFDLPLHYHEEYELALILNAKGAKRVVGNNIGIMDDMELIFIGPNLYHAWFTHICTSGSIKEIIIQFHKDLFNEVFLRKNQLSLVRSMLNNAQRGIIFPKQTIIDTVDRIINLKQKNQFDAVLELFSILHSLSICADIKLLSDPGFSDERILHNSRRLEKVFEFIYNNYEKQITLLQVSGIANMPPTSFSRFLKKRTGKTFIEILNEIRLGYVSRMLIDTNFTISQIAYKCGFNNISNFNRTFKLKKMCTPNEFRETYASGRVLYI
ncbi:MAG TPA: AraC family transcriptional regulator, partial [Mucilaginibacter sp.]|nr:AraC family transcriptional regulator [Mucilaginibacter sp.]